MQKEETKKVTVIIPTYKRADYIDIAIKSVINQTYKNIEIIIVDDNGINTPDQKNTEKKIQKYLISGKIQYIKHDRNLNGATARNTGIQVSKGEYITFLDDDDFFFKDRIETLVNDMNEHNEYDAVYSSAVKFKNDKLQSIQYANKEGNLQFEMLKQETFFTTGSNMFFTAKSLKEIGGFDVNFKRHQDLEVFVRFFEKYQIFCEPKILVAKCERDNKNFPNLKNAVLYREQYLNEFQNIINKYSDVQKKQIYHDNYMKLYLQAVSTRNKNDINIMKYKIKENNIKLSIKDRMNLILKKINSRIKIIYVYRKIRNKKYSMHDVDYCYEELKELKSKEQK